MLLVAGVQKRQTLLPIRRLAGWHLRARSDGTIWAAGAPPRPGWGRAAADARQQRPGERETEKKQEPWWQVVLLGHGVEPARIEWVAAQHTPAGQQAAFDGAVLANGFKAIARARWIEAAGVGWHQPRKGQLVEPNERQQQGLRNAGQVEVGPEFSQRPAMPGLVTMPVLATLVDH